MSISTIIACISSAVHDVELLRNGSMSSDHDRFNRHILHLRFLKTFVLCSKKLCNDESLKHFLVRIEENIREKAKEFQGFQNAREASRFTYFSYSLAEGMDEWYVSMLDSICTPHSTSLTANEILEIVTLVLDGIVNGYGEAVHWPEQTNLLKVQMRFFKNLIHFLTMGTVEARKDLLAYSETIAINIAYVHFHGVCISSYDEKYEEMLVGFSTLVQKMKPIDPRVCEIYTQSLSGSKLSEQLLDDGALLAVKNFFDSLMSTLAEIICLNTHHVGSRTDQLQELYERLKSLRIIVKQQPITSFDIEIQKEITDVVTDAGIFICSIHQEQTDGNVRHQHLLDKFEIVLSKIAEIDPDIPIFHSPRTRSFGFVDYAVERLAELTSSLTESTVKSQAQTIQLELCSVISTLGVRDEHVEVLTLWDRLSEVAFKVESAIDYQAIDPLSDSFSTSFGSIMEDIGNIKADMLQIEVKEGRSRSYRPLPSQDTFLAPNEVIGFKDDEKKVLDRLRGGSQHLQLIPIVGMPGLGKTTLAKKVYSHSSLSSHFSAKAWCTVSQVLDKKYVLIDLLKQICPEMSSKMSEHDTADKLRRSLKGKRYLIFLDDIWSTEAWDNLKYSFPDDVKGSRIIFTSRSLDVASSEMLAQEPVILSPLSEEDSLILLCSKLFPAQGYCLPPALHGLGMKIVARCGGLPLAIVIVAGVLANVEAEAWEGLLGSLSFLSSENNCRDTLDFSYNYLPDYLRPCFLYFGAFREDQEVSVRRLLRVWNGEGFVRKSKTNGLEDVAEGYLNMLIGRSLIMVGKRRSDGGVKTCRIHDLLHDFCLEKVKDEQFFHFAKGSDELYSFSEPHNLRRLLIDSEPEDLTESKFYCPDSRSLLLRGSRQVYHGMSPMLQFFKLLKVLDLEQISVGSVFPTAIEQLVLLSFLAVRGYRFPIPSWLANLSNLETLIISIRMCHFSLPDNVWNMQKLKYLYLTGGGGDYGGGVLPVYNLDDSFVLYELERFTGAVVDWCNMEKQLRMFPNIRQLTCLLVCRGSEIADKFVFPDISSKLESLDMAGVPEHDINGNPEQTFGVRFGFTSLTNLKKLKLADLYLDQEIFSVIGNQLPSLEVLKLQRLKFGDEEDYTWEMKAGEFSKLRILHVRSMPLRRWIACDDHEFECFEKLVLFLCFDLEELPDCLESIETLQEIEVTSCPNMILQDLVMKIGVEQNNWGNSGLRITIT